MVTRADMRIIDTHVHVWNYQSPWMGWLADRDASWDVVRRDFRWEELRGELDAAGVSELMLVQASPDPAETREFLALADREPSILGVVGWVSLRSLAATRSDLASLDGPGRSNLVGVRNNHGWAPDGEILASAEVLDACRFLAAHGLTLDLHFRDQTELGLGAQIAREVPDLTIIIDHLGKPLIRDTARFDQWKGAMAELASLPNVFLKCSGWATFLGKAEAGDVQRHIAHALDCFGPERTMFGSNWPVALVADSYAATYSATLEALPPLAKEGLEAILSGTALRCYKL